MANLLSGLLGIAMVLVFLGDYAIKLNTPPLWVIIIGVAVLPLYDYVQTVRESRKNGPS